MPRLFEIPKEDVLEVEIESPENPELTKLGLKWFAVPAVSDMALDLGGIQYPAAPFSGFYMGTEIGSFNLSDEGRYNKLAAIADAFGINRDPEELLWRDQAMLEINKAVLYSFRRAGVRIMDHHALSALFSQFRKAEEESKRPAYGHWPRGRASYVSLSFRGMA